MVFSRLAHCNTLRSAVFASASFAALAFTSLGATQLSLLGKTTAIRGFHDHVHIIFFCRYRYEMDNLGPETNVPERGRHSGVPSKGDSRTVCSCILALTDNFGYIF